MLSRLAALLHLLFSYVVDVYRLIVGYALDWVLGVVRSATANMVGAEQAGANLGDTFANLIWTTNLYFPIDLVMTLAPALGLSWFTVWVVRLILTAVPGEGG